MKKKVFIIGNGFDLDLGWKTRYQDFVSSDFWPLNGKEYNCPLAKYMANKISVDRWYDLEVVLKDYASATPFYEEDAINKDELFFKDLKETLTHYLKQEEQKEVNINSMASQVFNAILSNGYFSSFYTFNYTDPNLIAEKLGINIPFHYESVHGCIGNSSIILGVDDNCKLRDGYAFLRKVFSEHYTSHHIRYDLMECDEVVFFGHSLGDMDYPYFSDFFFTQSHCSSRKEGKRITFFTKDNHSRIQILEQLRTMNQGETEHLINDNDVMFIMTDNPNMVLVKKFMDHLTQDSRETHDRNLRELSHII